MNACTHDVWRSEAARCDSVDSLAPGKCGCNVKSVIFILLSRIDFLSISCGITLRWMSEALTNDLSALVQVMDWCLMAPSHYLSQCWPSSVLPYCVTRSWWARFIILEPHWTQTFKITATTCTCSWKIYRSSVGRWIYVLIHWSLTRSLAQMWQNNPHFEKCDNVILITPTAHHPNCTQNYKSQQLWNS